LFSKTRCDHLRPHLGHRLRIRLLHHTRVHHGSLAVCMGRRRVVKRLRRGKVRNPVLLLVQLLLLVNRVRSRQTKGLSSN
jgi:hypothetical protein